MIGDLFESIYTVYRATFFSLSGWSQFTKEGFQRNAASFTQGALDVNLEGKVAIVTGK
jgi:uncharacterized membrane protein YphA (DoxX/SURF4 family)